MNRPMLHGVSHLGNVAMLVYTVEASQLWSPALVLQGAAFQIFNAWKAVTGTGRQLGAIWDNSSEITLMQLPGRIPNHARMTSVVHPVACCSVQAQVCAGKTNAWVVSSWALKTPRCI